MKEYELMYTANPNLTEENIKDVIGSVEKLIGAAGGQVISSKALGRKAVQANFRKMKNLTMAHYMLTVFTVDGKELKGLGRKLGLQNNVLRHSIMIANAKLQEETVEV